MHMLQFEAVHMLNNIKLPFVIKIFFLSIFELQIKTGFTVLENDFFATETN